MFKKWHIKEQREIITFFTYRSQIVNYARCWQERVQITKVFIWCPIYIPLLWFLFSRLNSWCLIIFTAVARFVTYPWCIRTVTFNPNSSSIAVHISSLVHKHFPPGHGRDHELLVIPHDLCSTDKSFIKKPPELEKKSLLLFIFHIRIQ
jgi:hypothetical protein